MLDILLNLALCWPGHKKLYQDGVCEFVEEKIKATLQKNLKNQNPDCIKDDLRYIDIGCGLASDSEKAGE